MESDGDNNESE